MQLQILFLRNCNCNIFGLFFGTKTQRDIFNNNYFGFKSVIEIKSSRKKLNELGVLIGP